MFSIQYSSYYIRLHSPHRSLNSIHCQAAREEARKRKHEEKKKLADQKKLQEKIKLLEKEKERSKKEKHDKILRDSGKEHRHKVR